MTVCRITLNRCPHGVEMLSLDYRSSGSRFAGSKCCGQWSDVASWAVTANDLREILEQCEMNEADFEQRGTKRAAPQDGSDE